MGVQVPQSGPCSGKRRPPPSASALAAASCSRKEAHAGTIAALRPAVGSVPGSGYVVQLREGHLKTEVPLLKCCGRHLPGARGLVLGRGALLSRGEAFGRSEDRGDTHGRLAASDPPEGGRPPLSPRATGGILPRPPPPTSPGLRLPCCMTLAEPLPVSGPQFPLCEMGVWTRWFVSFHTLFLFFPFFVSPKYSVCPHFVSSVAFFRSHTSTHTVTGWHCFSGLSFCVFTKMGPFCTQFFTT